MPKTYADPTTAKNLEAKFDAGEDVLDYFDLRTAKIVAPENAIAELGREVSAGRMPSMIQLKRAVQIAERIQKLESELNSILVKRDVQSGRFPARKPYYHGTASKVSRYKGQKAGTKVKVKAA